MRPDSNKTISTQPFRTDFKNSFFAKSNYSEEKSKNYSEEKFKKTNMEKSFKQKAVFTKEYLLSEHYAQLFLLS